MITREDFKVKLREWLSEETCEKLAFEAEQRFTEDGFESVYEVMLIWMSGYDINEFKDMCEECGIYLNDDDDVERMYADMESEW